MVDKTCQASNLYVGKHGLYTRIHLSMYITLLFVYTRKTRTRFGHMHARLYVGSSRASMQLCTQRKLKGRNNCIIAGPAVAYTWSNVYRNTCVCAPVIHRYVCVYVHTHEHRFLSLLFIYYLSICLPMYPSIYITYIYIYIHVRVHRL